MSALLLKPLINEFVHLLRAAQLSIEPLHGKVVSPASRAWNLFQEGRLTEHQVNEMEGGKGFPAMLGHQLDPDAPDDVPSREPPWEGQIASGGRTGDARNLLNEVRDDWPKVAVTSGESFKVEWHHAAPHKTRRWSYWLTQDGWDSSQPLRREHFGDQPIKVFLNTYTPYWGADSERELIPATSVVHEFDLPARQGYHVLLAIWDVADTFSAFYQVIDLDFG